MLPSSPSISIESPTGHGTVVATMGQNEIAQMMPSRSSASLDHGARVMGRKNEIVASIWQEAILLSWTIIQTDSQTSSSLMKSSSSTGSLAKFGRIPGTFTPQQLAASARIPGTFPADIVNLGDASAQPYHQNSKVSGTK